MNYKPWQLKKSFPINRITDVKENKTHYIVKRLEHYISYPKKT